MASAELKVGQEVRVFDQNGRRVGQPDGGWSGKVTEIGRSLVTVEYRGNSDAFRMDTHVINDRYGHKFFKTLEEVAEDERRGRALATLKDHRIELGFGHSLTLEQIEALAELARTF